MNTHARILGIALALYGGSTAIASACCNPPPNVCAESISCEVHSTLGSVGVTTASATRTTATSPIACGLNVQCIENGIRYGNPGPVSPPDNGTPSTAENAAQAFLRLAGSPFALLFNIFGHR